MQQKRLLLALLISTAILFSWSYLFPVNPPKENKPEETAATSAPTPSPTPETRPSAPSTAKPTVEAGDQGPRRTVIIKTPLYEAKFDSQGAEVVSWIIKKNKDTGRSIYSIAGDKNHPVPL